jgi:hypothetical protein
LLQWKQDEGGKDINEMTLRMSAFLIVVCIHGLTSCSAARQRSVPAHMPISTSELSSQFIGEQGDIIRVYGLPDNAYHNDMGVSTWTYCSKRSHPVHIQFDSNGAVMNRFILTRSICDGAPAFPVTD